MKRILSTLFVVIAFVLMASGAQAAPTLPFLDVAPGLTYAAGTPPSVSGDPYVIGYEYLQSQTAGTLIYVDFGSSTLMETTGDCENGATYGAFGNILYSPQIPISIGTTLNIGVSSNGALKGGVSYYLWNMGNASSAFNPSVLMNAAGGALAATMVHSTPSSISAANYGVIRVQFADDYSGFTAIPNNPSVMPGDTLVLLTANAPPSTTNRPIFVFTSSSLTPASPIQIKIGDAQDTSGIPINDLVTGWVTVIKTVNQMSTAWIGYPPSSLMTPTTSVIDVNAGAGRLSFVPNAPTTALHHSKFQIQLQPSSATVNWGINICTATYTLTLADDTSEPAIATAPLLTGGTFTAMGTPPSGYIQGWTATGTAGDLLITQTVTINVNGTILNPGKFFVSLVLAPISPAGVAPQTVLAWPTLADIWTLNAMSIRIPYMLLDARTAGNSGYVSFIELVNRSGDDVCVDLDANISRADATPLPHETPGVFANSTHGTNLTCAFTLAAHAVTIVQPTDIVGYFPGSLDNTTLWRVGLTLYVAAPQNSVDATAFQIAPDGNRTNVPVLYNLNTTTSNIHGKPVLNGIGRQWLQ